MKFFVKSTFLSFIFIIISINLSALKELDSKGVLQQLDFFSEFNDNELEILSTISKINYFDKDAKFIVENQPLENLYFVLDSEVKVMRDGKLLATVPERTVLGEMEFLDKLPAAASVIVSEKTDILQINGDAFKNLIEENPRIGYLIMKRIAHILADRLRAMDMKK